MIAELLSFRSLPVGMSHPSDLANASVKSPTQPAIHQSSRGVRRGAHTHVHRDVVLLRRRREREGMPLPVRHLGTIAVARVSATSRHREHAQVDPLASASDRLLLLDLDLDDLGRMEDDLGDIGAVTGSNLAKDALVNVCDLSVRGLRRQRATHRVSRQRSSTSRKHRSTNRQTAQGVSKRTCS